MAKLYFYYSAMNAGKSTTLLQSSYNYQERGMQTLLFTPDFDTRHSKGVIASRIGISSKAVCFNREMDLYQYVSDLHEHESLSLPHCILVDEAHFLTKQQVLQLSDIPDRLKIPVLTYGLRTDFRGEPFEGSGYLLAWADELVEIKTICHCGRKAIMNIRMDDQHRPVSTGEQVEIGGNERYVSTCRRHFKQGEIGPLALVVDCD